MLQDYHLIDHTVLIHRKHFIASSVIVLRVSLSVLCCSNCPTTRICCFMCTFPELCLSPFHSPTQKITRWCHGWGTSRTMCLAAGWMRPTWSPGTCTGLETWPPARCSGSTKPPRWDGAQLKDITRNASFPLVDLQQPHEESLCSPCIKDFNANCLGNYRVLWTLKASQTCQIICFLC